MDKNVIVTKKARKKLVLARAGKASLPKITGMAFGDGGVDAQGEPLAPTDDQEELKSQVLRKEVGEPEVLEGEPATVRYTCTLSKEEAAGKDISEIGLYDADNDLVCIKTFRKKGKDGDLEMTFTLDDVF